MEVVIHNKIFEIRGQKVMLDFDLAALYEVETKVFNQAVKRNIKRFPDDFMFKLTAKEWNNLRSQFVTSNVQVVDNHEFDTLRSQFASSNQRGGTRYLPFAFTEQGVAMLSGVLNSPKAVQMNIVIMRTFVEIRRYLLSFKELSEQLQFLKDRMGGYDAQLNQIYEALETMLDKKTEAENKEAEWKTRERIGFKQKTE